MNIKDRLLGWYFRRLEKKAKSDPHVQLMQEEVNRIGQEYEQISYQDLLQPAELLSRSVKTSDVTIHFTAEAFNVDDNGDIHFCIDADGLDTKGGWKPSYQFKKRKDGTVYY